MVMEELLKIQDTWQFEEYGYINLVAVEKKELDLELKYKLFSGVDDDPIQLWQVICHEEREHKIILGEQYSNFELYNDHVLLWSYSQPISSLTFNKGNLDIDACHVIGKLYEKHMLLVGSWISFDTCLNQSKLYSLEKHINFGHGKLAEGAEKIIIGYQEVLQECGFKSSYLSRLLKRWDNNKGWIDENKNLQVLITGDSYIIAPKFTAKIIIN